MNAVLRRLFALLLCCAAGTPHARGLLFDEEMRGHGYWDGELRTLHFVLDVRIPDIDRWRASPAHPAQVSGSLRLDAAAPQTLAGTLEILAPAPNQDGRVLVYRLTAANWRFLGAKLVRNDGGFDLIDDVTTLHGVLLPRTAAWPSVGSLVDDGQWSSEVQFEWWRPSIVLAFLDSFATIDTPWYEVPWVKYVFIDTTFGAVAGEFLFDLL
ncbi:MAG TPA: hypothetical protein VLF18_13195 [Tahibacter sp.]|uniref:hypothetical protein n=1 Tax=Tahibacter sp. TaxID=2056211 RepID=UPI002B63B66A|nr:hypothetical protein [Tahibacter sp.]HSX61154.1 hypothetical protein [Tahibacter sp.]